MPQPATPALFPAALLLLSCAPADSTEEPIDCQVMVTVEGTAVLDLSGGDGTGSWSGHEDDSGYFQAPELDGFEYAYTERWELAGTVTAPTADYDSATVFTIELVASLPEGSRADDQLPDPIELVYVFDSELGTISLERTHQGECAGTREHAMTVTAMSVLDTRTGPIITLDYEETWYDWCGEDSCPTETGTETGTSDGTDVGGGGPSAGYSPYGAPAGPPDLSQVTWLHTDVSGWDDSAVLSSVQISSDQICLDHDQADVWPVYDLSGTEVAGNPWIFIWERDRWYAATWEWLRPGQTCKARYAVAGDHIKQSPFGASSGWEPVSGVTYYFMVSGLARGSERNVAQRTNLVPAVWP
jgi:hypothetical protein